MIAAIYARKSTEQNGVGDEEKSVTRQIEHSRAYAARKGWTVADEHVYVDDGVSGAEFVKRPGFLRLMNALKPKPPFQALIMSEESRLGREQIETGYALKHIIDAGVRVFFYLEDRERTLDSAMDKVMLSLTNFAAEVEREKAQQRTYDAMARKAKAGHVTGGRVYGYDNVEVLAPGPGLDGRPKRLHVERRIKPEQAAVVRRIFEWCAAGKGLKAIAKMLTAESVPPPRNDAKGWAPSALREMLYRSLYRGQLVWNQTRRVDRNGTNRKEQRPESERFTVDVPDLRIVSDELWGAAHARLARTRAAYGRVSGGKLGGRPEAGTESQYLLTGFIECAPCRGGFHVLKRRSVRRLRRYYGCTYHRNRGDRVCPNGLLAPLEVADAAVVTLLQRDVLSPAVVTTVIEKAIRLRAATPDTLRAEHLHLERDLRRLEGELARLADAVASGEMLPSLMQAIRERERRRAELQARLEHLDGLGKVVEHLDRGRLARELAARLTDWQGLIAGQPIQARQLLRQFLVGRLVFTPRQDEHGAYYEFTGRASYGKLLAGLVVATGVVPGGGLEPPHPCGH